MGNLSERVKINWSVSQKNWLGRWVRDGYNRNILMHVWISQWINFKYNLKSKRHLKNKIFSLPVFPYPLTYLSFTFWLPFSTPLSVVAALRTKYGMVFWEARNWYSAPTGNWKNEYTWRLVEKGLFPGHEERKSSDLRVTFPLYL